MFLIKSIEVVEAHNRDYCILLNYGEDGEEVMEYVKARKISRLDGTTLCFGITGDAAEAIDVLVHETDTLRKLQHDHENLGNRYEGLKSKYAGMRFWDRLKFLIWGKG